MGDDAENEVAIQQKSAQEAPLSTHSVSSLRDVERPDENVFDSNNSKYISQNYRRAAGAAYVLAMGVCGIVLVALASSLKSLAVEVERTSIEASKQLYSWIDTSMIPDIDWSCFFPIRKSLLTMNRHRHLGAFFLARPRLLCTEEQSTYGCTSYRADTSIPEVHTIRVRVVRAARESSTYRY